MGTDNSLYIIGKYKDILLIITLFYTWAAANVIGRPALYKGGVTLDVRTAVRTIR